MNDVEKLMRPRNRSTPVVWLAVSALILMTIWLGCDTRRRFDMLEHDRSTIGHLRRAHQPLPTTKVTRDDRERERRLLALQAERTFRWYPVFQGLEDTSSEDVELLEFAPDKPNRTFVLRGEAKDMDALLDYLASLSDQKSFSDVYLAHQKIRQRDNLTTIQMFEVRGRIR